MTQWESLWCYIEDFYDTNARIFSFLIPSEIAFENREECIPRHCHPFWCQACRVWNLQPCFCLFSSPKRMTPLFDSMSIRLLFPRGSFPKILPIFLKHPCSFSQGYQSTRVSLAAPFQQLPLISCTSEQLNPVMEKGATNSGDTQHHAYYLHGVG